MQAISVMLIATALISAVFGIGLFSLWGKTLHSRPLSALSLTISMWALFMGLFLSGFFGEISSILVSAFYTSAGLIPLFGLAFALSYSVRIKGNTNMMMILASSVVAVFCFYPDWLIKSVDTVNRTVELGYSAYYIYTVYFILFCLIATLFFVINMIQTRKTSVKRGLKRVLVVWIIGGILGSTFSLLLPLFGNYDLVWVAPPIIAILMLPLSSTLVTTVEHFSMAKTFFRGLLHFIFVALSIIVVFSITQFVSRGLQFAVKSDVEQFIIITVALTVLLPVIFLLFWLMRKAVRKIDSDGYDENVVLASMSHIIAGKYKPSESLSIIRHELKGFFAVEQVDLIIFEHNIATHLKNNALKSVLVRLTSDKKHNTIYCEDIKKKSDYKLIKSYNIEVIVPIVGAIDGKAVGAITLSPRKRRYDRQYGETLERVAIIISPYIQSSAFYEQILASRDKLKEEVKRKTQKIQMSREELIEANERKSEALHTASHNLRTPLTGVIGMISMVLDGDVGRISKSVREYLEIALQSGQNMNQVISTVLTASNIEAGKFELKKERVLT
jgi:hypothetical protein